MEFPQDGVPTGWSSDRMEFLPAGVPTGWSSDRMEFLQDGVPTGWSSYRSRLECDLIPGTGRQRIKPMTGSDCHRRLENLLRPLLQGFSKEAIDAAIKDMLAAFFPWSCGKGEHFAVVGEKSNRLGFVCRGIMRAYHSSPEGSEYTKTIFEEGVFVAPLAALTTGGPSPISLQALEPLELLVADYTRVEELYRRHHPLAEMARRVIQMEWVKKEVREIRMVTLSAEERYDIFLEEHRGLEARIPWYHIASYLGITPVALSRIRARKRDRAGVPEGRPSSGP